MARKYISPEEALSRMQRYCAYQERCHQEVRSKLLELGIYGDTLENVMAELIGDNFLNEERFARAFAGGKFRISHWGRLRIRRELQFRDISDYCIRKALAEIDESEYLDTLRQLLEKKAALLPEGPTRRMKLFQLALRKGYEADLIGEVIAGLGD